MTYLTGLTAFWISSELMSLDKSVCIILGRGRLKEEEKGGGRLKKKKKAF